VSRAAKELGWKPRVSAGEGLERLHKWIGDNAKLFV
jgi:nucleoside-diphosphate-sugar epimerase